MKKTNTNTFKNATIDVKNMTITEHTKDADYVFDLKKVLSDWDGIDGISLVIKQDTDILN